MSGGSWRPRPIINQCMACGTWKIGPFAGRNDVTLDEISEYMQRVVGHPARGALHPAPNHPESGVYYPAGRDSLDEPFSGGMCADCVDKQLAERTGRIARLRTALRAPDPDPPLEAIGTAGADPADPSTWPDVPDPDDDKGA